MRAALAWSVLALTLASVTGVQAQLPAAARPPEDTAPTLLELHALAGELGSANAAARERAFGALRSLGSDALPALRSRLSELRSRGFDVDATLAGMSELRRVQGVAEPDGKVDLALGAAKVLAQKRDPGSVLAVELIAYLRALEAQKSPAAAELIVGELFALDAKLFKYEAPRTRERLSVLILPALIRHRTHPKPSIRRFCEDSLLELRIDSPGRAVQQDDVVLLAAILDAYGDTLSFEAMTVVISYITDERVAVREAALAAARRFGKNAIWQLRERYVNATGNEPDPNWGWQRTLDELLRVHDGPKRAAFLERLGKAESALGADDVIGAEKVLEEALLERPHDPDAKRAGQAYARLAASHFEDGALAPALTAYRRALRLDPDNAEAKTWRARLLFIEAEQRLGQGIVDMHGYEQALALDPRLEPAEQALDELSGARSARDAWYRKLLGLAAAALLVIAGLVMLRRQDAPAHDGDFRSESDEERDPA
jgi:tetratricopeptide (TPR) repeat protein